MQTHMLTPEQVRWSYARIEKTYQDMVRELTAELADQRLKLAERCPHGGVNKSNRERLSVEGDPDILLCPDCRQKVNWQDCNTGRAPAKTRAEKFYQCPHCGGY